MNEQGEVKVGNFAKEVELTAQEIKECARNPDVLRALANYHSVRETEAASIDPEEFELAINNHRHRYTELRQIADNIESDW